MQFNFLHVQKPLVNRRCQKIAKVIILCKRLSIWALRQVPYLYIPVPRGTATSSLPVNAFSQGNCVKLTTCSQGNCVKLPVPQGTVTSSLPVNACSHGNCDKFPTCKCLFPWELSSLVAVCSRPFSDDRENANSGTNHYSRHIRIKHHDWRHYPHVHVPEHVTCVVISRTSRNVRKKFASTGKSSCGNREHCTFLVYVDLRYFSMFNCLILK